MKADEMQLIEAPVSIRQLVDTLPNVAWITLLAKGVTKDTVGISLSR